MLIVKTEGSVWRDLSLEQLQRHLEHNTAYIGNLKSQGKLKTVNPVDKGSRIVTENSGVMKDAPFNETNEVIAGYFIFTANDLPEAVGIAKANPIFKVIKTKIEVHPVMELGGN